MNKKQIRFWVFNGCISFPLILGVVFGIQGAMNVGMFLVWILAFMSLIGFAVLDEIVEDVAKKEADIPLSFAIGFDFLNIVLLAWSSHYITAVAACLILFFTYYSRTETDKIRAKNAEEKVDKEASKAV